MPKKMPKRLKAKWVKALRSGEYLQGSGVLKDMIGEEALYCCLGVLKACVPGLQAARENAKIPSGGVCDKNSLLNFTQAARLGVSSEIQNHLAHMNDTGKSFDTIATYIEENL